MIPAPAKRTPHLHADGRPVLKRSDDAVLQLELAASCLRLRPDFLVLVCADGDFAPLVWMLRREGIRTEVVSDYDKLASDLRRAAYATVDLREVFQDLGINQQAAA